MKTIWSHGLRGPYFGVELEIEAADLYLGEEIYNEDAEEYEHLQPDIPRGWRKEEEHSICGAELVFDDPLLYDEGCARIIELYNDIQRKGYKPKRTPRGSTHVHVNVSDLTYEQMQSFVVAAAWAEPYLIEIAGKGRKGNLFALPYAVAPMGWAGVISSVRNKSLRMPLDTHYMAVNFRQMIALGTVEFRMGPSMRNAMEAIEWFSLIRAVAIEGREAVVTGLAPPTFLDLLEKKIPQGALARVRNQAEKQAREVWFKLTRAEIQLPTAKLLGNPCAEIQLAPMASTATPGTLAPMHITSLPQSSELSASMVELMELFPVQTATYLTQTDFYNTGLNMPVAEGES